MAGLVPAIHVIGPLQILKIVDARAFARAEAASAAQAGQARA
jgi:hypothetical protein